MQSPVIKTITRLSCSKGLWDMMKHWIVGYDSHIPLNYTDCSWHTVENRTTITVKNEVTGFDLLITITVPTLIRLL